MKRYTWHGLWIAAALLLVLLSGCGQPSAEENGAEETDNLPVIVVGCDTYPPYSYIGVDGQPVGIDVELAREALHRMGYRPKFVYIDWEKKKDLLAAGEIDCIWSSFSINGREEEYHWAGPYMISRQVVAVLPESDITALSDLEGKSIAVQTTTKPEEIFLSHSDPRIPQVGNLFSMQNRELIYPVLSKGYVDAVAAHETSIRQYMSDYHVAYRILDDPLLTVGLGVAFDKNDERGLDIALSETLEAMRMDGTTETILGNYLTDPESYLEVGGDEG